ncbi:tetratricopeptide repeat-containing sensor histidine kinase [Fulvivirga lutea]|uniref:histidine kinase n=1 Tax=Fulvivirga lutea TaxID=2810512 RepID=A0A974WIT0_9BACT|nr:tetratricopeptide repeat-containing sensor histidine kinase [Fulvivirga lutea]QSE98955.1 tetratricopeptide repeat protein [Fulvivirga lutea]
MAGRFILSFTFCLFLINSSYSQQTTSKDNIDGIIDQAKSEMVRFNHDKAISLASKSLKDALNEDYKTGIIESLMIIGESRKQKSDFTEGLNNYLQALSEAEKLGSTQYKLFVNEKLGQLFYDWGVPEKALLYFEEALRISEKEKKTDDQLLNEIAETHIQLRNYSETLSYYQQLLRRQETRNNYEAEVRTLKKISSVYTLMKEPNYALNTNLKILEKNQAADDKNNTAVTLNSIGFLYRDLNQQQKALEYFERALELNQQLNTNGAKNDDIVSNLINIGVVQQSLGDYRESMKSFRNALEIKEESGSPVEVAVMHNYLASINYNLGKNREALDHCEEAIGLLENSDNKRLLASVYKKQSEIMQRMGSYQEALASYKKYTVLKDSILFKDQLAQENEKYKEFIAETTEKESKLNIIDQEMKTLELTNEKVKAEQEKQAVELMLREQEVKNISLQNEQLAKERQLQKLLLQQEKIETEQKDQEIQLLEQTKELQSVELQKKNLEEKERLREIELQKSKLELQESQLETSRERQRNLYYVAGLFLIILILIFGGYIYQQRVNTKLKTQYEQINEQKQEIEKINKNLVELNEEKNDLIGIVAHDLKSPLNQIAGMLDIIKMTASDKDDDQKELVEKIDKSAKRMKSMVTQILDVNAIESKSLNMNIISVATTTFLTEIIDRFEPAAEKKEITIDRQVDSNLPSIKVDEGYASEVLENLMSNSIKYSPLGKKVRVKASQVNGYVRMEFKDEGQGISKEDMKKLFGKFHKLSARPTAGEDSTGLGLSIVKRYVEALNGNVWCESEEGNGANFIVEFPVA